MQWILGLIGSLFFLRTATAVPFVGPLFWLAAGLTLEACFPGTAVKIGDLLAGSLARILDA
jgi:hypothetical protein